MPRGVPGGRIMIPLASSAGMVLGLIPSSWPEHIIPRDSTPLSLARLITSPPASLAPSTATGITSPARTLVAAVIICSSSAPVFTLVTTSLSALGWGSMDSMRPVITFSIPAPGSAIPSTVTPARVRRSASSPGDMSISTNSCSHLYDTRTCN